MLNNPETSNIKKAIRTAIEKNEIPGANLLIFKNGKEVFYHEDGLASREEQLPIRRDTIFRLFSMTKPITAAAAMILTERGKIDLYEPVGRYLEGFRNQLVEENGTLVPANREMRIKDLLNMTSGLLYGGEGKAGKAAEAVYREIDEKLLTENALNTIEIANRLGKCPLAFHPGDFWAYGTSADVLAAVIEAVSGMKYGEFLKKEIFEPLGMKDTGFYVPAEKKGRLANTYGADDEKGLTLYTGNNLGVIQNMDREPAYEAGGAGLVSTIDDYARFSLMLMNGGSLEGVSILHPRTVAYMTSKSLTAEQYKGMEPWLELEGHSYGSLMRVMTDTTKAGTIGSPLEYGWDGWLGCYFANCPVDNLNFLFMTQKTDAGTMEITRKLRNIIISSCSE
ncbi:serine hydrolase domain-containing protein [Anaerocolumna xylanovorans]|uniref:CubicO group peptidase, beta-lactamase class C family n=1 Tax=Anaerocolumna xylanovorans DSM 12503 TaxID=1121345 RepID=A0A1M7XZF6_9FIRM|nr:serine hydrolase domain-containing protein [Anaerocolumna xylanovorans]SHO44365.1 CubicO group peptidase, beta-lactamase class C family [Anaerocolumna xylanovorans DSM 12503]